MRSLAGVDSSRAGCHFAARSPSWPVHYPVSHSATEYILYRLSNCIYNGMMRLPG